MTPCPECNGAGFFGGTGPVVENCGACRGTGEVPERAPAGLRAVSRVDQIVFKQIFWDMEERRQRGGF
jgi:DnaJ-class molecular chaperone